MHKQVDRPTSPLLHRGPRVSSQQTQETRVVCGEVPRTASLITVLHVSGSSIVTCADDSPVPHQDASDSPFHTVAALGRQGGQTHEILIPVRSDPAFQFIGQI